jgi:hypothetical protein
MEVRGPLVTLGAVAALGVGIWLVNVSKEDPAPAAPPAAEASTSAVASPSAPPAPPPAPAFPAKADYVGKVPTANGVITVEISVEGEKAIAYACDGNTVESWLRGSAVDGAVSLKNKDKTSRLEGRLEGTAVAGTLRIGERNWQFTAPAAPPPAGLYVYDAAGVRSSWIVDGDGGVTGVLRSDDGLTQPAPPMTTDGLTIIDGRSVKATRVQGKSSV